MRRSRNSTYEKHNFPSPEAAQEAYLKAQRDDEDPDLVRPGPPARLQKSWAQLNQDQRNELIERFEEEMLEVYGCFPKQNWMN